MKKVSIIAPFYDESIDNFKRQYNSIKNQSLKNFEYIIILDNPNNLALENHIKSQIKGKKNIILIKNKKNIGCNPSLNKGIKKASGKYICFIGGSDELPKNSLKDRYVSLSNNPDIAVIFSNWTEIDESKKSISRKFPSKNINE